MFFMEHGIGIGMAEINVVKIASGSLLRVSKNYSVHFNCLLVAFFVFVWNLYFIKGDNGLDFLEIKYSAVVGAFWYPIIFFVYAFFEVVQDVVRGISRSE